MQKDKGRSKSGLPSLFLYFFIYFIHLSIHLNRPSERLVWLFALCLIRGVVLKVWSLGLWEASETLTESL